MITQTDIFPQDQFHSLLASSQIKQKIQPYLKQVKINNISFINSMVLKIIRTLNNKQQLPNSKWNALMALKLLFDTAEYLPILLIEIYLLPIVFQIAAYRATKRTDQGLGDYFIEKGFHQIKDLKRIGFNFVLLANQFIFTAAQVKPYRSLQNIELEQQSNFSKVCKLLISKGSKQIQSYKFYLPSYTSKVRKNYLKKLSKFNPQEYTNFYLSMLCDEINLGKTSQLDMKKMINFADAYFTIPLMHICEDQLNNMEENFHNKRKYLNILGQLMKNGDIYAVLIITRSTFLQNIFQNIRKVDGELGLDAGQKIYPHVAASRQQKKNFYVDFLKNIQIWAYCHPLDQQNQSTDAKKIYDYLKKQRKFIFPQNILLPKLRNQMENNLKINNNRNQKLIKLFDQQSFVNQQQNQIKNKKSSKKHDYYEYQQIEQLVVNNRQHLQTIDKKNKLQEKIKQLQNFSNIWQLIAKDKIQGQDSELIQQVMQQGQQQYDKIKIILPIYKLYTKKAINFQQYRERVQLLMASKFQQQPSFQKHLYNSKIKNQKIQKQIIPPRQYQITPTLNLIPNNAYQIKQIPMNSVNVKQNKVDLSSYSSFNQVQYKNSNSSFKNSKNSVLTNNKKIEQNFQSRQSNISSKQRVNSKIKQIMNLSQVQSNINSKSKRNTDQSKQIMKQLQNQYYQLCNPLSSISSNNSKNVGKKPIKRIKSKSSSSLINRQSKASDNVKLTSQEFVLTSQNNKLKLSSFHKSVNNNIYIQDKINQIKIDKNSQRVSNISSIINQNLSQIQNIQNIKGYFQQSKIQQPSLNPQIQSFHKIDSVLHSNNNQLRKFSEVFQNKNQLIASYPFSSQFIMKGINNSAIKSNNSFLDYICQKSTRETIQSYRAQNQKIRQAQLLFQKVRSLQKQNNQLRIRYISKQQQVKNANKFLRKLKQNGSQNISIESGQHQRFKQISSISRGSLSRILNGNSNFDQCFPVKINDKFKKDMLKNKNLIFKNQKIEFGTLNQTKDNFLQLNIFITSLKQDINNVKICFNVDQGLQVRPLTITLNKIKKQQQVSSIFILKLETVPYKMPSITVSFQFQGKKQTIDNIYLPLSINKFLKYFQINQQCLEILRRKQSIQSVMSNTFKIQDRWFSKQKIKEYLPYLALTSNNEFKKQFMTQFSFKNNKYILKLTKSISANSIIEIFNISQNINDTKTVSQFIITTFKKILQVK